MTLTLGSEYNADADINNGAKLTVLPMGDDKAVILFNDYDGGIVQHTKSLVVTVSGTTVTQNATYSVEGTDNSYYERGCVLSATTFLVTYYNEVDNGYYGKVGTVSGTSISYGSEQDLSLSGTFGGLVEPCYIGGSNILISYPDSGIKSKIFTVSGSTLSSAGTPTSWALGSLGSLNDLRVSNGDNNKCFGMALDLTNNCLWLIAISVSGTTISPGAEVKLGDGSNQVTSQFSSRFIANDHFVIGYGIFTGVTSEGGWGALYEITGTNTVTFHDSALLGAADTDETVVDIGVVGTWLGFATIYDASSGTEAWRASEFTLDLTAETITNGDYDDLNTGETINNTIPFWGCCRLGDQKGLWFYQEDNAGTTEGNFKAGTTSLSPPAVVSHIWLSGDGGATYTDIGDSATWTTSLVGGVVVKPGTSYQTIWAIVGSVLYKTTNGGTSWASVATVGYEADFIDLLDGDILFVANRASGGNRASLILDSTGAVTHINTGKTTTGGNTSGQGVS